MENMINPVHYNFNREDVIKWYIIGGSYLLKVDSSNDINRFYPLFDAGVFWFDVREIFQFDQKLKIKNSHDFGVLCDYLQEGGAELW